MRRKIIMDESRWLLEAITEEFEAISQHTERIPKIETDILMENLRKLYENLRVLQRLDDPHLTDEHLQKIIRPTPSSPTLSTTANVTPADPKPETPPLPLPGQPLVSRPSGTVQVKRPENTGQVKKASKAQDIDLFAQEDHLQTVKLQDARERAFSPKIPGPRVDNLKMAIPINDKFMFINDLFDGNLREYNETIEALNGFKTLEQAAEYFDLMKKKNLWDTTSVAFEKLKELLERRF
jgi:hypothetical protein